MCLDERCVWYFDQDMLGKHTLILIKICYNCGASQHRYSIFYISSIQCFSYRNTLALFVHTEYNMKRFGFIVLAMIPFINILLFKLSTAHFDNLCPFLLQRAALTGLWPHKKKHEHSLFRRFQLQPFMFSNELCFSALPTRQSSFPDRKSLQGLSPRHRWPFNTSLATANEPGVAAAWLDPADFAQMFISHSPAVLGLVVHFNLGSSFTLFIQFCWLVTGSSHF